MTVDHITDSTDPEVQAALAVDLPEWVTARLAPAPAAYTIRAEKLDGSLVTLVNGLPDQVFRSPAEAYDHIHALDRDADVFFDDSINTPEYGELCGGLFFCTGDTDYQSLGVRGLVSSTHEDHLFLLKYAYLQTQKHAQSYQEDPEDWYNAYQFVNSHPAFWTFDPKRGEHMGWDTEGAKTHLWSHVERDETGQNTVMLELGGHVLPECAYTYRDDRLDVYAHNFEDAYVKLARLVDNYFNPDGSEKEHVSDGQPDFDN